MKIREGAYYRTRDGDVVGPVKHKGFMFPDDQHPFFFLGWVYDSQGRHKSSFERQNDLISEVYVSDTPPADAPSPETKNLRDEFAITALRGLVANPNNIAGTEGSAKWAYRYADAMMEARKK